MMVAKLTQGQAIMLRHIPFAPDSYFNPKQDADGNWFITLGECEKCTNPRYQWVKTLPQIVYNPKPSPPMPGVGDVTNDTEILP